MKILFITLGVFAALFSIAQILQLLGIIGVGPNIAGVALTAVGLALSLGCFQKAFKTK
jgi:hypothetical protein